MRVTGYCEQCHRVRPVQVSNAGMVRMQMRGVPTGTCTNCQQEEDDNRRLERAGIDHRRLTPRERADALRGLPR